MITHFAELELYTLSLSVVRLVYHERLRFPIRAETDKSLAFALTPHTVLKLPSDARDYSHPHPWPVLNRLGQMRHPNLPFPRQIRNRAQRRVPFARGQLEHAVIHSGNQVHLLLPGDLGRSL
jgi:hypothetical protein